MGKLMRRAELQDKYDGVLQWGIPRDVVSKISDYARQETMLDWLCDNGVFNSDAVWLKFLEDSEKSPNVPIEDLLDGFKEDYERLCEIHRLELNMYLMHRLLDDPSIQPLFGLADCIKLYEKYEARLAKLREEN